MNGERGRSTSVRLAFVGVIIVFVVMVAGAMWLQLDETLRRQEALLQELSDELEGLQEKLDLLETRAAPAWVVVDRQTKKEGINYRMLTAPSYPPYRALIDAMKEADSSGAWMGFTWTDYYSGLEIISLVGSVREECLGREKVCGTGYVEYDGRYYWVWVAIQLERPVVG